MCIRDRPEGRPVLLLGYGKPDEQEIQKGLEAVSYTHLAAAMMIYFGDKMPNWLLLIVIFFVSGLAGLIWGVIPAIFKAYFNTNETLFTLMLNYVAMQIEMCIRDR